MPEDTAILVEIAAGELIDKITILEIKAERIEAPEKLRNIRAELATLIAARDRHLAGSAQLTTLTSQLRAANEALWSIEDEIRDCERRQDFGPRFVELARAVYHSNDRRCEIKRAINQLVGSRITEEKSYKPY
jgi:hypothetical protein